MHEIGKISITKKAKDELNRHGYNVSAKAIITDDIPADSIGVGAFYLLDKGLIVADNIITKCKKCCEAIQFRPHFNMHNITPLCCFCAADRILDEYWKEYTESENNATVQKQYEHDTETKNQSE